MKIKNRQLFVDDMQCAECETVIEEAIALLPGIQNVDADFGSSVVKIQFDSDIISLATLQAAIVKAGYHCQAQPDSKKGIFSHKIWFALVGGAGIALLLQLDRFIKIDLSMTDLQQNFSYSLLFLIGILTSFHCIGMCGSFVIGYSTAAEHAHLSATLKHLLYGLGKLVSYTFFGALFGLLGQFVIFTPGMQSLIAGLAGGFLIVYGLSMLDAFRDFRHLRIMMPKFLTRALIKKERSLSNPLFIGLMNGLMLACGPLQAMYVMAAGTGDMWLGAKMLAVFALGTLPIMFVFGSLTSLITANTSRQLLKISALIIIGLGVVMLNRGLIMAGQGYDFYSLTQRLKQQLQMQVGHWQSPATQSRLIQEGYQVIYMEADGSHYQPASFDLQKNVPVKWIINGKNLSVCNNTIIVPSLNKTIHLQAGLQLIEFTPTQVGQIHWSCSMGMIPGVFSVQKN